jgi:hypothetical protein
MTGMCRSVITRSGGDATMSEPGALERACHQPHVVLFVVDHHDVGGLTEQRKAMRFAKQLGLAEVQRWKLNHLNVGSVAFAARCVRCKVNALSK